ncbi:PRC-barrel domain-containing protein [Salinarimonas soli]|uniref:PRC-barrel domain containing protein n=1 Tax=Salinarimonas soli TaxID=1638099 RepID=A0A5B2VAW5_9HYPH|nr:PRC-barrel domain-containing protein [Salinarimonas soli]KAA2236663.1 PRC-barrel domain containing protein [Salinarimonas soli]
MAESREPLAVDETDRLIAANKVEGTAVFGRSGERLGEVYTFMVDKRSGQVAYAVLSLAGRGGRYHPLPWKALDYDTGLGGFRVDLDGDRLAGAPHYGHDEDPLADPQYGRNVYGYYGIPYYF